jgi:alginate O-acetyltransferase complex protein AlgI
MAKKILVANPMGHIADSAFAAGSLNPVDAWYGVLGYAFQIYFDFSGYSDMAVGLALMMGFVLIQNFDSPYKSDSITDFWRRWHISLSTWLRDYLYIPLGGNRRGEGRTYVNLMTVMLLGGLWHGASWNFVIWGAIHGGMLAAERAQGNPAPTAACPARRGWASPSWWSVCPGCSSGPRRCPGASTTCDPCSAWRRWTTPPTPWRDRLHPVPRGHAGVAAVIVWGMPNTWAFTSKITWPRAVGGLALLALSVLMMWTQTTNPFLYFQF